MQITELRHAFITGGASGIGLALADALAARGVAVTIADLNEDALAEVLATRSERFQGFCLDTRNRDQWALIKAEAEALFGPVDLLVNNAGIAPDGQEFADIEPESFDRVIAINLGGVFNGISAFAADMRAQGRGHIVNTSSMSGMVMDGPGLGGYGPSKAGVIAMSEILRMEMEPHGVGVSVLCPSYVATNLMANTLRAGGQLRDPDLSLLGAPTKPPEVAEMIIAGIEENRPFIFTHSYRRGAVQERHETIMECFDATERHEAEKEASGA